MCVCSLLSMIMVIFVLFGGEPNHWVSFQKNVLVCGVCVCGAQPDLFFMIISMIFDYAIFVKYFFFCLLRWLVQMFAIYRIAGGNGILALGIAIERWLCIFAKWWAAWIPLNWLLCAYACVIFPFLIHFRKALSFQRKSGTVTKKMNSAHTEDSCKKGENNPQEHCRYRSHNLTVCSRQPSQQYNNSAVAMMAAREPCFSGAAIFFFFCISRRRWRW